MPMKALHLPRFSVAVLAAILVAVTAGSAAAADMTVREVVQRMILARNGPPADFARRDLSFLDLSGLDFSSANLASANLFGTDLTGTNLSNANLAGAMLDRTVIIKTNFTGANMIDAKLRRAAAFSTLEVRDDEAPNFTGAN